VSLNPTRGKVYSIQHNEIKFVSYVRQVLRFPTPLKQTAMTLLKSSNAKWYTLANVPDRNDITDIFLQVTLNTQNTNPDSQVMHFGVTRVFKR
jgi:hypothetical protein